MSRKTKIIAMSTEVKLLDIPQITLGMAAGDELRELLSKDIFDLKRNLNDEIREKEAVQRAAAELRNMVKNTEAEKVDLNRSVGDLKQRVGSEYCQYVVHSIGPTDFFMLTLMWYFEMAIGS